MSRAETRQRRWDEMVDAAAKVFYTKGYGASAVQDVADEIGLLKGSVYHYINTKEDLLYAVVEQAHAASMENVARLRASEADAAMELRDFVAAHLDLLMRERIKLTVYLHDFRSLTDEHRQTVAAHRREYSGYLEDLIARGQSDGVFSSTRSAHILCLGVLGMLNWTYEWWKSDSRRSRSDVIVTFADMALRSVGVSEADLHRVLDDGFLK